jgi:WD40 repeat protein
MPLARIQSPACPAGFSSEDEVWLWQSAPGKDFTISTWQWKTETAPRPPFKRWTGAYLDIAAVDARRGMIVMQVDQRLEYWNAASGAAQPLEVPDGIRPAVCLGEFSPDGRLAAFALNEAKIGVWDLASGRLVRTIDYPATPIRQVLFSPDGTKVAACGLVHDASLWDLATGRLLHTFKGNRAKVYGIAFSADGQTLVTAGTDWTVRFFNLTTGREAGVLNCPTVVDRVWLSPDNNLLATMERFQPRVWELAPAGEGLSSRGTEALNPVSIGTAVVKEETPETAPGK